MDKKEAKEILYENLKSKNLRKHCIAVEAIMGAVARKLNKKEDSNYDVKKWMIAGLLHDIDYDETEDSPKNHSIIGSKMLEEKGLDSSICYAVKAHNEIHGFPLKGEMDIALYAADPISGLIVASALISPGKNLDAIDSQFILNRFKEKSFARGAKREQILACRKLGFSLEEFIDISLGAMKEIHKEIGL